MGIWGRLVETGVCPEWSHSDLGQLCVHLIKPEEEKWIMLEIPLACIAAIMGIQIWRCYCVWRCTNHWSFYSCWPSVNSSEEKREGFMMTNLKAQLDQQCRVQHCWSCPKGLKHWDRNQANASVHCPGTNSIRPCVPALSDTLVLASVKKEHIKCTASVTGSLNLETRECYCCCCAEVSVLACWQDLSRGSGKLKNNEPQRWQTQRPWQVCPHRRQPQDIHSRAPVWSNLRRRTYRSGRSFGNPSRHIEVNSCRAKWSWEATKHRNLAQCNRGRTFVVTAERQWSRNSSRSLPWWTQWLELLDTMSHRNRTAREVRGTLYRCWVLILLMMAQASRWTEIAHHFLQEQSGTRQPPARLAKNYSSRLQTLSFEYLQIDQSDSSHKISILTASFAACLYVHLQQLLQLIQRRKLESQSVNPLETKKETIIENATTTAAAPWWHHSSWSSKIPHLQ